MIECRDESRAGRQQHAVAEHVAAHVADADGRNRVLTRIQTELAEMPFDGFPGAARRDAHLLVVVAGRSARRERIAQPESILGRKRVGDIGEAGRAFVGGDDEIRVGVVPAERALRAHDLPVDDVIGQIQQAADERLVAVDDFALHGIPILRREGLADESALRAARHDDGIFHLLGLHEAQNLGAKIFAPVRPTDAASSDLRAPKMYPFDALRVDENFELRSWLRQIRQRARIELEGQIAFRLSIRVLVVVAAQQRVDDRAEAAQDPVVVETHRPVEVAAQRFLARGELSAARRCVDIDVEETLELLDERPAVFWISAEDLLHVALAVAKPGLEQVSAKGAQQRRLPPIESGSHDEGIEAVVVGFSGQNHREAFLDAIFHARRVERLARRRRELEVLNPDRARRRLDPVDALADDLEAHVLEHGQGDIELDGLPRLEGRESQPLRRSVVRPGERHFELAFALVDSIEPANVMARAGGVGVFLVGHGEVLAEAVQELERTLLGQIGEQGFAQSIGP